MQKNLAIERTEDVGCYRDLVPIAALVILLSLGTHLAAGDLALPFLGSERLAYVLAFAVICGIFYPCAFLLTPILDRIFRGSATEDMTPPWKRKTWSPLAGTAVILLTLYGVTSTSNLTELYRAGVGVWHDAALWKLEYPLFEALRHSWLNQPFFWDIVYFQMWPAILFAAVYIHSDDGIRRYAIFGMAILLAFLFTRALNLAFPTAGPAFFLPGWFDLEGTVSSVTQDALREFTAGRRPANGIYPATMAMPSLHVGLTGIAAWFLAHKRAWTLYLSVPWLLMIWMSTVVLGWHYVLDGPAGLGVAGVSVFLANFIQNAWDGLAAGSRGLEMAPSAEGESPLQPEGE